jgi:hypothetical protein
MNWRKRLAIWLLRGVPLAELLDDSRRNVFVVDNGKGEPIVFADPHVLDFETLGEDFPLTLIPAYSRPGHSLSESFFVVRLPENEPKEAV